MSTYDLNKPDFSNLANSPKVMAFGIVAGIVLLILFNCFQVVGPGERGVTFSKFLGVRENTLGEGMHFKLPFIEEIITMDVRVQKVQSNASAASKDLQNISSVIAVNFHVDPERAHIVFQEIGRQFGERVIDPAVQESVKAVAANFTAEELITRRGDVKNQVQEGLSSRLARFNIILDEFSIVDFAFSEQFNRAIEEKQTAEQNALKAKRDLDRIKIEAEQRITVARGEAEAQRLQSQTITPIMLQLRAIEKWNGILPQVTSGATPFIDVKSLGGK